MAGTTVLLVDDDPGMVETLSDILSARGYGVVTARSGLDALGLLREARCTVALMDIRMPGLNGVETLEAMRAVVPALPVIMMTAFTRDELVEEARRASAVAVLTKPLDLERVLRLVASVADPPA